jgi:prevent-host-death family protein
MRYSHKREDVGDMGIGVRELRDNLRRYLGRVRAGEHTLIVTDHGRAVARVLPMDGECAFDRLVAEGVVTPARRPKRRASKPLRAKGAVSDLVSQQRR